MQLVNEFAVSCPCPVCGNKQSSACGVYRGSHTTFRGLKLANCGQCNTVFACPMPDEPALSAYNNSYFSSAHGGHAKSKTALAFFNAIARLRCGHIERYRLRNNVMFERVLELGPGPGYLAQCLLQNHPKADYFAVETDRSCYESLRRVGVSLIDLQALRDQSELYDLIVMSHVLEHISTPTEFLRSAIAKLRTGGILFIEVPCHDFVHKELDEPHVLFFDKDSLGYLLNALKLEEIRLSYHGKTLDALKKNARISYYWNRFRSRLVASGVVFPFAESVPGLEVIHDPLQRAVIKPYLAHLEQEQPSWWLRAMAVKG